LQSAKKLPSFFDQLVLVEPVGEEDSKWRMDPQAVVAYKAVLKSVGIGRWKG